MGSQKKWPVRLTVQDREELVRVATTGVRGASMITRARVLLALDTSGGEVDPKEVIAARLGVSGETLRLIAMACSQPPEGYARWSLRLLEKHVALVQDIPDLDHSTIGRVLKRRNCVLI